MGTRLMKVTGEALARLSAKGLPRTLEVIENALPENVRCLGVLMPTGELTRDARLVLVSDDWSDATEQGTEPPELPATAFRTWMVPGETTRA